MKEFYSTVEVSKLCSVTRFSVINWTNQQKLKSTKTPGGHRRIHRADLIAFLKTYRMGTDSIKYEKLLSGTDFLKCWEYHKTPSKNKTHDCQSCVVYLSGTTKCFTLREHIDHKKMFCQTSCSACAYYQTVHQDTKEEKFVTADVEPSS